MGDTQDSETLPKLNSSMFKEEGQVYASCRQLWDARGEELKVWTNSIDFYLELNGMTSILFKDHTGGYHIKWHKENK